MGRGDNAYISTYLNKGLRSELSGNMIDLCPVGALTSKPFQYKGRSWGFKQHMGVSPHDCVGSNMNYNTVENLETLSQLDNQIEQNNQSTIQRIKSSKSNNLSNFGSDINIRKKKVTFDEKEIRQHDERRKSRQEQR